MATKIRPLVFKINEPEGFTFSYADKAYEGTMSSGYFANWQSPTYPEAYQGEGKHVRVVVSEDIPNMGLFQIRYMPSIDGNNGSMCYEINVSSTGNTIVAGTYEGTLTANPATTMLGVYIGITIQGPNPPSIEDFLSKVTITILD